MAVNGERISRARWGTEALICLARWRRGGDAALRSRSDVHGAEICTRLKAEGNPLGRVLAACHRRELACAPAERRHPFGWTRFWNLTDLVNASGAWREGLRARPTPRPPPGLSLGSDTTAQDEAGPRCQGPPGPIQQAGRGRLGEAGGDEVRIGAWQAGQPFRTVEGRGRIAGLDSGHPHPG